MGMGILIGIILGMGCSLLLVTITGAIITHRLENDLDRIYDEDK